MKLHATLLILFLFATVYSDNPPKKFGWIQTLKHDLNQYFQNGQISQNLNTAFDMLRLKTQIYDKNQAENKFMHELQGQEKEPLTCDLCLSFAESTIGWFEEGLEVSEVVDRLATLCVDFNINSQRACKGFIELHSDTVNYIYGHKNATGSAPSASNICGFWMYPNCPLDESLYDWTLDLDFLGPKPTPETPQLPPVGSPSFKVLQLTDMHADANYVPGYNAVCGEPVCCRFDQGKPEDPADGAGYWGDYRNCDQPIHAFQNLLQEAAATQQDIAYIIFTGDTTDHAIWATSNEHNADLFTQTQTMLATYFPDVPILSVLGNHEPNPVNMYSDPKKTEIPENLRTSWLYELAADMWGNWLPAETRNDILSGGMYATEVRPGLVVIGINTMFCYHANWWLLYDNVDPAGELTWLANKLLEVEQAGKKAHILSHVPSGMSNCMHFWSIQYRRIIDRFENTVIAQFHGHTHMDHFYIYYDLNDPSRPSNVAFAAGSGTAFMNVNPNYRTYTVDAESYRVLNHETWYYNLTEANLAGPSGTPNWTLLYSFNEAYGTSAPFPADLDALVHRMVTDAPLQQLFYRYYVKESDLALEQGCDDVCLRNVLCNIVTTVINDKSKCDQIFPPQ